MFHNQTNNPPFNWEEAADKNINTPAPEKKKKPLKLSSNAQAFNPQGNSGNDALLQNFTKGQQPAFDPSFQKLEEGGQQDHLKILNLNPVEKSKSEKQNVPTDQNKGKKNIIEEQKVTEKAKSDVKKSEKEEKKTSGKELRK